MNIIFDFGNVLVRWEPERVYLPYFGGEESKYWFFWRHVCDATFRNRIDAGEDQRMCIAEQQRLFPEYAEAIDMYHSRWEEALPGEMPGLDVSARDFKDGTAYHSWRNPYLVFADDGRGLSVTWAVYSGRSTRFCVSSGSSERL